MAKKSFPVSFIYVSPYIKGFSMIDYNAHTLGSGGYTENVFNGIQYCIMECSNIEIFAGRGLYLGVNDGRFYEREDFVMNTESGVISRNDDFDGKTLVALCAPNKES